jgi:hypothetical protein
MLAFNYNGIRDITDAEDKIYDSGLYEKFHEFVMEFIKANQSALDKLNVEINHQDAADDENALFVRIRRKDGDDSEYYY